jgi:hypothetical protein
MTHLPPGRGTSPVVDTRPQAIVGATITPDVGAIVATFTTVRPSKPVFTVWRRNANVAARDMVPANQVAFSGETLTPRTSHSVRIASLPQGLPLWLRITADAEDVPAADPLKLRHAQMDMQTGTYVRTCVVRILSVEVLNSGDSGGGASMLLQFQVYNGTSSAGESLIATKQSSVDSIDNGEFVGDMVGQYKVDSAPDTIVPYMSALHWRGSFPVQGRKIGDTLPSGTGSGSDGEAEWADCLTRVALPTRLGDTTSSALMLGTGLLVPSIDARLTIETNVTNPSNIETVLQRRIGTPPPFTLG